MTLTERREAMGVIALGAVPIIGLAAWLEHQRGAFPVGVPVVVVLVVMIACIVGHKKIAAYQAAWAAEWKRRRRITRRYRAVRRDLSISCACGTLAKPIPGTRDRYRCSHCGYQCATSPHRLRPLREYLTKPDTKWPL